MIPASVGPRAWTSGSARWWLSRFALGEVEKAPAKREESLWPNLARLERDMERMVESCWGRPFPFARDFERFLGLPAMREMPIEMFDEKDDLVVKVELPGIAKQDLEVSLADNRLTVSAERCVLSNSLHSRRLPIITPLE